MSFLKELDRIKNTADAYLESILPPKDIPQGEIIKAMDYSLNAGGKRIRPIIAIGAAEALGGKAEEVLPFAAAIEMIHTYSLIHDDLPCMDNDDLRRSKPTNHKVFGEGKATLAGDALLNYAFETALKAEIDSEKKVKMLKIIAKASGVYGMIGGQVLDLEGEKRKLSKTEIKKMYSMKTGALIKASAAVGAVTAGAPENFFDVYSENLGLAFQLKDDILDETSTTEEIGKPVKSDEKNEKSTFITVFGKEETEKLLEEATENAVGSLPENCLFLKELALYLLKRTK